VARRIGVQGIAVFALSVIVVSWFLVNYGSTISVSAILGSNVIVVLPGLLITFLGIIAVVEAQGGLGVVGCFALMGVGLAILLGEMYTVGVIDDVLLAGATLVQLQAITIIISLLMGGVAYVSRR
jgi:hypothetical protein